MNRLTKSWLWKNGVSEDAFANAVARACDLVEDEKEPGERILLTVAWNRQEEALGSEEVYVETEL